MKSRRKASTNNFSLWSNIGITAVSPDEGSATHSIGRVTKQVGTCVQCQSQLTFTLYCNGPLSVPLLCETCLDQRVAQLKHLRSLFPAEKRGRKKRQVA